MGFVSEEVKPKNKVQEDVPEFDDDFSDDGIPNEKNDIDEIEQKISEN